MVGTKPAPRRARARDPTAPHAPRLPAASRPSGGLCGGEVPRGPPRCLLPADIEGLNPIPGCGEEESWGARWDTPVSLGVHRAALGTPGQGGCSVRMSSPASGQALMSRGATGRQQGAGRKAGCTRESRVLVSPRAGKPAVYGVAVQAGRVCLQRLARQREPERGGRGHPRDHEQEPHRWVTGAQGGWGEAPALPSFLQPPGSRSGRSGQGLRLWDGEAPSPALPRLQAAAEGEGAKQRPRSPWQDGRPAGRGASSCASQNPAPLLRIPKPRS